MSASFGTVIHMINRIFTSASQLNVDIKHCFLYIHISTRHIVFSLCHMMCYIDDYDFVVETNREQIHNWLFYFHYQRQCCPIADKMYYHHLTGNKMLWKSRLFWNCHLALPKVHYQHGCKVCQWSCLYQVWKNNWDIFTVLWIIIQMKS